MPTKVTIPECQQNILEKNGKLVISRAIFNDEITVASTDGHRLFYFKFPNNELGFNLNKNVTIPGSVFKSQIKQAHQLETKNINACSNVFSYILRIFKERNENNSVYLILSITPLTFLSACILSFFKKKFLRI